MEVHILECKDRDIEYCLVWGRDFNYVGHGSVNSLTEEQTIVRKDIENMRNDNLALWITATCDFSRYDNNKTSGRNECIV